MTYLLRKNNFFCCQNNYPCKAVAAKKMGARVCLVLCINDYRIISTILNQKRGSMSHTLGFTRLFFVVFF
jgi:hypothetical protein